MEIKSVLHDKKVNAYSILIEIKISDYIELAKKIIKNNEFKRKRVRGSKGVYSLLRNDLINGCVIPPIVLAYTKENGNLLDEKISALQNNANNFSILDGLQRTYTILDISNELEEVAKFDFGNRIIRCEIYQGIDRLGILYRMLTLNTGQTAMSLRHQIEIMYMDYLNIEIDGIQFVRERDGSRARDVSRYNFKDVIEGFNSYIERNESPIDRSDILENISSLENLSKENKNRDVFIDYIKTWNAFVKKVDSLNIRLGFIDNEYIDLENDFEDSTSDGKRVWAKNGVRVFKRAQAISGFGAAIGLLRDDDINIYFNSLEIDSILIGGEPEEFLEGFNRSMNSIYDQASKIGNAQRLYFRQFFRMLFWDNSGCYLNLVKAQNEAYKSVLKFGI